jgi:hypothetical protein
VQTIEIRQFNVQYNVARTLDNPTGIQRRLDQIASQLLAQTLENQLAQRHDVDGALYFIEQLHFDLPLDLSLSDDRQLATVWAGALYGSIQRTLSQSGMGVICFRDRSMFIASFLEDLMQGRAWNFWYYAEFANLQSVSVGQATLNLLTLDGDVGRDTLLELSRRDSLERLLTRLTDAEVAAIATQCLLPPSPTVILPNAYGWWIDGLRSLLNGGMALTGMISRDLTRLYLGLLRQQPEFGPDVNLARFIQEILLLRQAVMELGDSPQERLRQRAMFLAQLAADDWTEASRPLGRSSLQPLLRTLAREVAGIDLVGLLQDLRVEAPATPTQHLRTAFGGIFLLMGTIADLDLYRFLQTCPYPDPLDVPKANLLLWLMALQCLGQGTLEQARRDRAVLRFAGLTQAPDLEWLANYGLQLTEEMHRAFGQALQAHCQRVLRQPDLFIYQRSLSSLPEPSEWLSLHAAPHSPIPDAVWDNALGVMSAFALQGFAARLGALAGSSPSYLSRNFLECEAEIWVSEGSVEVHFLTCPLQMVLKMAGFEHFAWTIPWLGNQQLMFNFDS